jgi:hypothetical protein
MAEQYENYQTPDKKVAFKLKNPDGTPVIAYTRDGKAVDKIDWLTPEEAQKMKGAYILEPVEPKPDTTHINLSQTNHDKEE